MFDDHDFESNQFQQYSESSFLSNEDDQLNFNEAFNDYALANNTYAQFENDYDMSSNEVQSSSSDNHLENFICEQEPNFNPFDNEFDIFDSDCKLDLGCNQFDNSSINQNNVNEQSNSSQQINILRKNKPNSTNEDKNHTLNSNDSTLNQFHSNLFNRNSSSQSSISQISDRSISVSVIDGERFKKNYYKHFTGNIKKHARKELVIRYHKLIKFYYPDDIRKANRNEIRDISKYFEAFAPMEKFIMKKIQELESAKIIDYKRDYQLLTSK